MINSSLGGVAIRVESRPGAQRGVSGAALLVAGLAAVAAVRLDVAGPAGVASVPAGAVFAVLLAVLCTVAGSGPCGADRRAVVRLGGAGAALLCAVPVGAHLLHGRAAPDPAAFPGWVLVVTAVAVAEEAFLRGALWQAVLRGSGERAAVAVTSVAFAVLHVPFYGAGVLPLDLAVGLLLGALRLLGGGWGAPALAHALADAAGWWLL